MATAHVTSIWSLSGDPGPTTKCTVLDAARTLTQLGVSMTDGDDVCKGALITCETNDIRFAEGGTVADSASSTGHVLAAGGSLRLSNRKAVTSFTCCNKTASSTAVIQVTLEF